MKRYQARSRKSFLKVAECSASIASAISKMADNIVVNLSAFTAPLKSSGPITLGLANAGVQTGSGRLANKPVQLVVDANDPRN